MSAYFGDLRPAQRQFKRNRLFFFFRIAESLKSFRSLVARRGERSVPPLQS